MAGGKPTDLVSVATEGLQVFTGKDLALKLDDFAKGDKGEMQEFFSDVAPALVEASMYEGSLYVAAGQLQRRQHVPEPRCAVQGRHQPPTDDWTYQDFRRSRRSWPPRRTRTGQPETFGYAWTNRHWGGYVPWVFVNDSNLLTEERAPGGEWLWSTFYANDPAAKGRGGGWRWNASKANDPKNVEALQFLVDHHQREDRARSGGRRRRRAAGELRGRQGRDDAGRRLLGVRPQERRHEGRHV